MKKNLKIRWQLVAYDLIILAAIDFLMLVFSGEELTGRGLAFQVGISVCCIFAARLAGNIYGQIWRYGGIQCYIRLIVTDMAALVLTFVVERSLPIEHISFARLSAIANMNLLCCLAMRMFYRYAFKCGNDATPFGRFLLFALRMFAGSKVVGERTMDATKINIAIIGAGRVGVSLAEELLNNAQAAYSPRCFVDVNREKVGRDIHNIPVLLEDENILEHLKKMDIQEVVFAIPTLEDQKKKARYEFYRKAGYKIKVYDYPTMQSPGGRRHLREFDIEELLFRKPIAVKDERTIAYYRDKVVLITGFTYSPPAL